MHGTSETPTKPHCTRTEAHCTPALNIAAVHRLQQYTAGPRASELTIGSYIPCALVMCAAHTPGTIKGEKHQLPPDNTPAQSTRVHIHSSHCITPALLLAAQGMLCTHHTLSRPTTHSADQVEVAVGHALPQLLLAFGAARMLQRGVRA